MSKQFGGVYDIRFLDASKYAHGLVSKGYWLHIKLDKDKLILPAQPDWNQEDKEVKVIHWAGGNLEDKMNFNLQFQPEVAKWLKKISS